VACPVTGAARKAPTVGTRQLAIGTVPSAELTLPAETRSVGVARRFLHATVESWNAEVFAWPAGQVLTELTTNAVLHAGTDFTVTIGLSGAGLWLAVRDASPRMPRRRRYGPESTTGRGITVVARLTTRWGVTAEPSGKTVWCELVSPTDGAGGEPAALAIWLLDQDLADPDRSTSAENDPILRCGRAVAA